MACLVIALMTHICGVVFLVFLSLFPQVVIAFLPAVVFIAAFNYNNWFNKCMFAFNNKSIHNYCYTIVITHTCRLCTRVESTIDNFLDLFFLIVGFAF